MKPDTNCYPSTCTVCVDGVMTTRPSRVEFVAPLAPHGPALKRNVPFLFPGEAVSYPEGLQLPHITQAALNTEKHSYMEWAKPNRIIQALDWLFDGVGWAAILLCIYLAISFGVDHVWPH
jgi:hypothetical protein